MMLENVFMIRGGDFGKDFGTKLIMAAIALVICIYDWKTNDRRKDYFWVFLFGTIIWSSTELLLQLTGTRILQEKYFFGIDITNVIWLTVPLQGMSEGAFVAVLGTFLGDQILKEKKKGFILFGIVLAVLVPLYLRKGINFESVNAGDLSIPSRRDMFPLSANIFIAILCVLAITWFVISKPKTRKRGLMMYLMMALFIAWWTLMEWLAGDRWIELGTLNPDGSYSNLRRAPAVIEFFALAYDYLIEVSLIYVPFLAIPYWLKLIKTNGKKDG